MNGLITLQQHHNWHNFYQSKTGYAFIWLSVYAITMAIGSSIFFYEIPLPDGRLMLSSVTYLSSNVKNPSELERTNWTRTTLPDSWQERKSTATNIWYRTSVNLDHTPKQLWAILIPAVKMNAAVFLNGKLLGSGGRFSDPVARNWMRPLLFSIPDGLLHSGNNIIHVRVKSDPPGSGQLCILQLAPYKDLVRAYDIHYLFHITSIEIITTMLLVMGGFIAVLWLVRRQETYYGYYALAVIIWGIHNFNIFITDIPVSTRLWDWFAYITIGFYTFLSLIFIHRFLGKHHPRIEIAVITTGLAGSIILAFLDDSRFYSAVYLIWYPIVFSTGFYILTYTCIEAWKRRSVELQFLTATGGITMLYASHDMMVMHGLANWEDGYFIQYAAAVLLTLFSIVLLRRYTKSLHEIDSLNRDLEKRVEEKHIQLEENYNRLRQMESERVLAEERERLTRDMHDGMGGHLVSTLAMIESGNASMQAIATALKDSLDDLRLMIDSMDIQENDLATLLGMFRMRIAQRLKNSQLTLRWLVDDIPPIQNFGPQQALHVLRILQEAITNTIKHAQANSICLSTYLSTHKAGNASVIVEISDNGNGITASNTLGNGLKNMHHRARMAGGTLEIHSDTSGTQIRLLLPVS